MGGGVSSKSQMNSEKFLMFSLVMLEMFLNTVLCSWHTRYPLIQHLLVLVRIRSQPTLTSTSGLFCTSHLLTLPLHLIMKVKMKQRSSQVRLWVFFFFLCYASFISVTEWLSLKFKLVMPSSPNCSTPIMDSKFNLSSSTISPSRLFNINQEH